MTRKNRPMPPHKNRFWTVFEHHLFLLAILPFNHHFCFSEMFFRCIQARGGKCHMRECLSRLVDTTTCSRYADLQPLLDHHIVKKWGARVGVKCWLTKSRQYGHIYVYGLPAHYQITNMFITFRVFGVLWNVIVVKSHYFHHVLKVAKVCRWHNFITNPQWWPGTPCHFKSPNLFHYCEMVPTDHSNIDRRTTHSSPLVPDMNTGWQR